MHEQREREANGMPARGSGPHRQQSTITYGKRPPDEPLAEIIRRAEGPGRN